MPNFNSVSYNGDMEVFKRHESKYLITREQKDDFLRELKDELTHNKYYKSTIENVYLDTENDTLITKSIDKPNFKEKVRVRSYGVPRDEDEQKALEEAGIYVEDSNEDRSIELRKAFEYDGPQLTVGSNYKCIYIVLDKATLTLNATVGGTEAQVNVPENSYFLIQPRECWDGTGGTVESKNVPCINVEKAAHFSLTSVKLTYTGDDNKANIPILNNMGEATMDVRENVECQQG